MTGVRWWWFISGQLGFAATMSALAFGDLERGPWLALLTLGAMMLGAELKTALIGRARRTRQAWSER